MDSQWPDAFLLKGSVLTLQLKFSEAESVLRKGELLCGGIRTAALSAALGRLAKMRLESVTVGEAVAEAGEAAPAEAVPAEGGGASGGEADKFDGLEGWLASDTDHNTSFPKLYMKKYMEGNRGVHCREDVPVRAAGRCRVLVASSIVLTHACIPLRSLRRKSWPSTGSSSSQWRWGVPAASGARCRLPTHPSSFLPPSTATRRSSSAWTC